MRTAIFALAFLWISIASAASSAHLCLDASSHKTIRDGACNVDEQELSTEAPAPNQGREGQGHIDVTHMPRERVRPSYAQPQTVYPQYDACAQVSVPQCDEYPSLSRQWSDCRTRTKAWIERQCVAIDQAAEFETGERRTCMKTRAKAYCRLERHYETIRR